MKCAAYLSDVARWVEQVDLSESLPKMGGRYARMSFRACGSVNAAGETLP